MKRRPLLRRVPKGTRMAPKPIKFVAEVPLISHPVDGSAVIGSAKIETLHGTLIAHIDASEMTAEHFRRGFSLGSFAVSEEPGVQMAKGTN